MADLEERFRSLARTPAPNLWPDARIREPRRTPVAPPPGRRWVAGVVAFAVAVAGIAVAFRAFSGERPSSLGSPVPITPKANGKIVFLQGEQVGSLFPVYSVAVAGSDGSGPTAIKATESNLEGVAWSPDGSRIAYVDSGGEGGPFGNVWVMNADGTERRQLVSEVYAGGGPSWSADGMWIAYSAGTTSGAFHDYRLFAVPVDGGSPIQLTDGPANDLEPSWSPGGTRIAFERAPQEGGGSNIYVMNVEGSNATKLTDKPALDTWPVWSPDGQWVLYERGGTLVAVHPDGSGSHVVYDCGRCGFAGAPSWSPDGTTISVTTIESSDTASTSMIIAMNPDGSNVRRIEFQGCCVSWQPIPTQPGSPTPAATPTPTETLSPSLPSAHVAATIDVGPNAVTSSILYADGSVWITAYGVEGGDGVDKAMVFRIDPATNGIVARIPVDATPTWEIGGGGIASGDGSIWVTGSGRLPGQGSGAVLDRIDPVTNEVVATMFLGGSFGADVVVDDSGVWVLIFDTDTSTEVLRLDPATGDVVATIGLDAEWAQRIFSAAGAIWVNAAVFRNSTLNHFTLVKIDPAANSVVATLPNAEFGTFDTGAGVIWTTAATGGRAGLARIDPETVRFVGDPIPMAQAIGGLGLIAGDPGGIWLEGYESDAGSIERYNPATGEIDASVPTPKGVPLQMAIAPGSLWTVNGDGTVTRIDLG